MSNSIDAKGKASAEAYADFALDEYATDAERFSAKEDYFAGFVGGARYYEVQLTQLKGAIKDLLDTAEYKNEKHSASMARYLLQRFK